MKNTTRFMAVVAAALVLLALGAASGWWWAQQASPAPEATTQAKPASEPKVLYWYDPMVPQQHFDKPGKSPFMDMELVPKYADEETSDSGVRIDPAQMQNLGVRLATVERTELATAVEASGIVGYDEREVAIVQSRTGGFVERVWPLAPGDVVRAGQPLANLLTPEWAAARHEFLAVRGTGNAELIEAARDRLRLLGMSAASIKALEKTGQVQSGHTVHAPIGGVLQALEVRNGMTLLAGQTVARINGLSRVWLEAAVPEAQAALVREGIQAEARLAGFPGRSFAGKVIAVLPGLNESSRSLRVRIELPNKNNQLRPGMTGQVKLVSSSRETALTVPTEAVIRTGKRALVMLASDKGHFTPVEVTLGREQGERTVIASGLEEGQQVVASGQFLIDSEASLSGVMARDIAEEHGE